MFDILLFILILLILGQIGKENPYKSKDKWSKSEYKRTCRSKDK